MGFLDFLFKKNYNDEDIVDPIHDYAYHKQDIDPLPRKYSDKGVTKKRNKQGESWIAQLYIARGTKKDSIQIYIGSYATKEEAQKARWEFIESLK